MAVRPILKMGDSRLARLAQEVTDFAGLAPLLRDMRETMLDSEGVGLAAPQIGVDLQVVVFGFDKSERYPDETAIPFTVLINPRLTPLSDEKEEGWEGCLSVPGLRGNVPRWKRLRYEGFDENGTPVARVVEGFHARVVQHEVDHLEGVLFPERIPGLNLVAASDTAPATAP